MARVSAGFAREGAYLTGDKKLMRKLVRLATKDSKRVIRSASSKAWTPVSRQIRQNAPVGGKAVTGKAFQAIKKGTVDAYDPHGMLKRSIGKKVKTYQKGTVVVALAGARSDFKVPSLKYKSGFKVPAKYDHLVELGTDPHDQPNHPLFRVSGHPGAKANPFTQRAFQQQKGHAVSIMRSEIKHGIEAAATKD